MFYVDIHISLLLIILLLLLPFFYAFFKMCPLIFDEGLFICWSCKFSFHKNLVKMAENAKIWISNCPLITKEQITCKPEHFLVICMSPLQD